MDRSRVEEAVLQVGDTPMPRWDFAPGADHPLAPLSLPARYPESHSSEWGFFRTRKLPQEADQAGQFATGKPLVELHSGMATATVPACAQRHPGHRGTPTRYF
jgi:hypothetical protein